MIITPYIHDDHQHHIYRILNSRGLPGKWAFDLPEFGLVALHEGNVVACGFIRKLEGHAGVVDGFLTDPKQSPDIRNRALDLLTNKLGKIATHYNVKLMCFTIDQTIIDRAIKHGYIEHTDMKVLVRKG